MLKIRRPLGRLIFNMGIAIHGKTVFLIETAPCRGVSGSVTSRPCGIWGCRLTTYLVAGGPFSLIYAQMIWSVNLVLWRIVSFPLLCACILVMYIIHIDTFICKVVNTRKDNHARTMALISTVNNYSWNNRNFMKCKRAHPWWDSNPRPIDDMPSA